MTHTHSVHPTHNTHKNHHKKPRLHSKILKETFYFLFSLTFISSAIFLLWIGALKIPDFNNFENRKIANSTKIYDRTGKVLLYNIHDNIKRTQVSGDEISNYIKIATISIEDRNFYNHYGISPRSILRSVLVNINDGEKTQGGSTITQQVIKNALLTREKTIVRKLKEWVLAIKLDSQVSKDDILTIYLNESPYGGSIYGVEEASLSYFNKKAKDIDLIEAAYLAAIPKAPSRYSPFGSDTTALENRKNLVLSKMYEYGHINKEDYESAILTKKEFTFKGSTSGKALHFVFYVKKYLEEKYGKNEVENGGLKVITTLDYDLQENAEKLILEAALTNEKKFGAKNSALVAIDPKTGQILSMVGSRDYFDESVDGKFNVAISKRQPGSTFKPFVYLLGLTKGYTPETVLFDVPTNFSTSCDAYGVSLDGKKCYMPENYDGVFHGPVSIKHALLWSLNIPAVKMQYLTGVSETIDFVKKFGLEYGPSSNYGLSLSLGAGEVSLLDLATAYAVFANSGYKNENTPILEVKDNDNNILEKYTEKSSFVIDKKYTDTLNSMLIDSSSRVPAYSVNNPINYYDREVAVKTGTTNDFKDVWVIGYTPSLVLGMWGGNNDNAPVTRVAGTVLSPVWRKVMDYALKSRPVESFDKTNTAAADTPRHLKEDICIDGSAQSILAYVSVRGVSDPQYNLWNTPIQNWISKNNTCRTSTTTNPSNTSPSYILDNDEREEAKIIREQNQ